MGEGTKVAETQVMSLCQVGKNPAPPSFVLAAA